MPRTARSRVSSSDSTDLIGMSFGGRFEPFLGASSSVCLTASAIMSLSSTIPSFMALPHERSSRRLAHAAPHLRAAPGGRRVLAEGDWRLRRPPVDAIDEDLHQARRGCAARSCHGQRGGTMSRRHAGLHSVLAGPIDAFVQYKRALGSKYHTRSEERRVGKECRSRWSPY